MKNIMLSFTMMLILPWLIGCASLVQTATVQEVIRKPKNYCELTQAEKAEITLKDIPIYDDSPCYIGKGEGIRLEARIRGEENAFWGEVTHAWGNRGDVIIMPYASKENTSYYSIPEDICQLKDEDGSVWKSEYKVYFGKLERVIRFVKKRKLTTAERQEWLQRANHSIEENYQQEQQENNNIYAECNADYDKIVEYWQSARSIKRFCGDIKYAYITRYCLGTEDDNDKCKTLTRLLYDCYKQETGSTDDVYVSAFGQFNK